MNNISLIVLLFKFFLLKITVSFYISFVQFKQSHECNYRCPYCSSEYSSCQWNQEQYLCKFSAISKNIDNLFTSLGLRKQNKCYRSETFCFKNHVFVSFLQISFTWNVSIFVELYFLFTAEVESCHGSYFLSSRFNWTK